MVDSILGVPVIFRPTILTGDGQELQPRGGTAPEWQLLILKIGDILPCYIDISCSLSIVYCRNIKIRVKAKTVVKRGRKVMVLLRKPNCLIEGEFGFTFAE